jgi:hypothetical protein
MANITKAEREQRAEEAAPSAPTTVPMHRNPEQFPAPHQANVHPAEVQGWQAHGWRITEPAKSAAA